MFWLRGCCLKVIWDWSVSLTGCCCCNKQSHIRTHDVSGLCTEILLKIIFQVRPPLADAASDCDQCRYKRIIIIVTQAPGTRRPRQRYKYNDHGRVVAWSETRSLETRRKSEIFIFFSPNIWSFPLWTSAASFSSEQKLFPSEEIKLSEYCELSSHDIDMLLPCQHHHNIQMTITHHTWSALPLSAW